MPASAAINSNRASLGAGSSDGRADWEKKRRDFDLGKGTKDGWTDRSLLACIPLLLRLLLRPSRRRRQLQKPDRVIAAAEEE